MESFVNLVNSTFFIKLSFNIENVSILYIGSLPNKNIQKYTIEANYEIKNIY